MVAAILITLVLAYFAGSLPTGYLVARAMRVDITRVGSGNIGATNVFRVLGKGPGALVLTVDLLKGAMAVHFAPILASHWSPMAALIPSAFGVTVVTWLVVFFLSRYVSLASIGSAIILPFATAFFVSGPTRWPLVGFTSVLAALAVWRHRANIERLKAGTEHRFGKSKLSAS